MEPNKLALAAVVCVLISLLQISAKPTFTIDYSRNEFLKDGQVFRYISGSMHYFRTPPELWRDRLQKMKFGGLNAVQTYIEWATIEHTPGVYDFTGMNNLTRFIEEAQEERLLVIVRVGPFIDAERDMGGLPSWLLRESANIKLRTNDSHYLAAVDRWLAVLLPLLKPLLYQNGGPIIMVQVENEYGSYTPYCSTNDAYKVHMRDTFRKHLGNEVVLFTTDGSGDNFLKCGKIPEVFVTVDFGSGANVNASFAILRQHQPHGPLVNSEFYSGWLDHWETPHSTRKADAICKTLEEMFAVNASVNIYMYHGGTNFGFTAGSNQDKVFEAVPTSYDYDAPISEAGDLTPKFYAIKEVIKKHFKIVDTKVFVNVSEKMHLPPIKLERKSSVFDVLPQPIHSNLAQSFEQLNQSYGFVLYRTNLAFQPTDPAVLEVHGLHDRAQVFVDHQFAGILSETRKILSLAIYASKHSTIDILVENQGRLCYGTHINERKGILSNVQIDKQNITSWNHYRLFDNWNTVLSKLVSSKSNTQHIPSFYTGTFQLPNQTHYPQDSFLQVNSWGKGVAFLNGHNLGKYWPSAGPQLTLYAPSVYFRAFPVVNEIVLFELEHSPCEIDASKCTAEFVSNHVIDGPIPNH